MSRCEKYVTFRNGLRGNHKKFIGQLYTEFEQMFMGPINRIVDAKWYEALDQLHELATEIRYQKGEATSKYVGGLVADVAAFGEKLFPKAASSDLVTGGFKLATKAIGETVKYIQEQMKLAHQERKVLRLESKLRQAFFDEKMLGFLGYYIYGLKGESPDIFKSCSSANDFKRAVGRALEELVWELTLGVFVQYFFVVRVLGSLEAQAYHARSRTPDLCVALPELIVDNIAASVFQMDDVPGRVPDDPKDRIKQFEEAPVKCVKQQWKFTPGSMVIVPTTLPVSPLYSAYDVRVQYEDERTHRVFSYERAGEIEELSILKWFENGPRMLVAAGADSLSFQWEMSHSLLAGGLGHRCSWSCYPPLIKLTEASQIYDAGKARNPVGPAGPSVVEVYGQVHRDGLEAQAGDVLTVAIKHWLELNRQRREAMAQVEHNTAGALAVPVSVRSEGPSEAMLSSISVLANDVHKGGSKDKKAKEKEQEVRANGGGGGGAKARAPVQK